MPLAKLIAFIDDIPWCGTRPPGPPRPGQLEALFRFRDELSLNPQPIPPGSEIGAYLWQAVQLHQLGTLAADSKGAATGELLLKQANEIFDDWCGTVPIQVLLQHLRRPPPPPPPWLGVVSTAVGTMLIAGRISGDAGTQMQEAATAVIKSQFSQPQTGVRAA